MQQRTPKTDVVFQMREPNACSAGLSWKSLAFATSTHIFHPVHLKYSIIGSSCCIPYPIHETLTTMPDLNELLRWSILNSTAAQQGGAGAPAPTEPAAADPANEQMTLRFRPTANPSAASSALHPNDPQYRPPGMPYDEDDSPPSSAGPATPKEGAALLPGTRAPAGPSHLNSEIIDLILGRPDSAVMKEKMEIAMDESRSVDERVEALDDFEMVSCARYRSV